MALLQGLRVVQLGEGLAAAVCGRWFVDAGASVVAVDQSSADAFTNFLNRNKAQGGDGKDALASADLIVCEGSPGELLAWQHDPDHLRQRNSTATIALISPYGQTGPRAEHPATDLTLFCASGMARLLTGQVDDVSEAPIRPVGRQSAIIGGLAAACAAMAAIARRQEGTTIDVSIQEALATLAVGELTQGGLTGSVWSRKRMTDGNGATVTILPARDGYVAVSPREEVQWTRWLAVMGQPDWADDARFARKSDRVANWDALYALMSEWSIQHTKQWIADQAQGAHVPSFPLEELVEHLASEQLRCRHFFQQVNVDGRRIKAPEAPYRLDFVDAEMPGSHILNVPVGSPITGRRNPLDGVRVLDFSWVIAGPTTTRHLAALGAEVIKVEAPGRGDPARQSHLHTVLGQGKKSIVLDLKKQAAIGVAKALVAKSDVLIENFATGVMSRLGLDPATLKAINPNLIYISASGMGRTGPDATKVAYGTLLQSFSGYAGLNRHADKEPRVGFAWLDPMCGLMLPFIASAAIWHREQAGGKGVHVDFSMLEAMLWTLSKPVLEAQIGDVPRPVGNLSDDMVPHGVYPCAGGDLSDDLRGDPRGDQWVGLAVQTDAQWQRLCGLVPTLAGLVELDLEARRENRSAIDAALKAWTREQSAAVVSAVLIDAQIAAASVVGTSDLIGDAHLQARSFWHASGDGVLPGLPWRATSPNAVAEAPEMGADTDSILTDILQMPLEKIVHLREIGAIA